METLEITFGIIMDLAAFVCIFTLVPWKRIKQELNAD